MTGAPIVFLWGDDAWAIEAAVAAFRRREDLFPTPPERWTVRGDEMPPTRLLGELGERLGTASMFGSGTLAVVAGVAPLVRRTEDRLAVVGLFGVIAPGNGLAFAEETESGRREAPHKALVDAVRAAGGREQAFRAPKAGELTSWIEKRAAERGVRLGPGAARELAARVGGFVTEGDVDRRRQGQLAVMELEKLSLYRLDGAEVSVDDVRALSSEAVPGSIWAFVDAVGLRNAPRAIALGERIYEVTPEPVVVAVLHRRIRELLEIADRLGSGEPAQSLPRTMKLNPYRAEQLATQAARWPLADLEAALEGLLDLDAMVKGVPGTPAGDAQHRLAFVTWISDRVARKA